MRELRDVRRNSIHKWRELGFSCFDHGRSKVSLPKLANDCFYALASASPSWYHPINTPVICAPKERRRRSTHGVKGLVPSPWALQWPTARCPTPHSPCPTPLELSLAWRVVPPLLLHSGTSKENVPPFFDCPTPGGQASQKVVPGGVGHFVKVHCMLMNLSCGPGDT